MYTDGTLLHSLERLYEAENKLKVDSAVFWARLCEDRTIEETLVKLRELKKVYELSCVGGEMTDLPSFIHVEWAFAMDAARQNKKLNVKFDVHGVNDDGSEFEIFMGKVFDSYAHAGEEAQKLHPDVTVKIQSSKNQEVT